MTEAFGQDPITPTSVVHRMEFGDTAPEDPGSFGHLYNYLDYLFRAVDGRTLQARHYFDEPDTAILQGPGDPDLADDFTRRVLIFLGMRYARMDVLAGSGRAPLPPETARRLAEAVRAYMIRVAV